MTGELPAHPAGHLLAVQCQRLGRRRPMHAVHHRRNVYQHVARKSRRHQARGLLMNNNFYGSPGSDHADGRTWAWATDR